MDLLFSADVGQTIHDVTEVMLTTLRTVIQTTIAMDRESPLVVCVIYFSQCLHFITFAKFTSLKY